MHNAQQAEQLPLPLPDEGWSEQDLRVAHRSARLRIPFEAAMRDPALAICLRCLCEARHEARRKAQQKNFAPVEDILMLA
jgi:hypothetical protein